MPFIWKDWIFCYAYLFLTFQKLIESQFQGMKEFSTLQCARKWKRITFFDKEHTMHTLKDVFFLRSMIIIENFGRFQVSKAALRFKFLRKHKPSSKKVSFLWSCAASLTLFNNGAVPRINTSKLCNASSITGRESCLVR